MLTIKDVIDELSNLATNPKPSLKLDTLEFVRITTQPKDLAELYFALLELEEKSSEKFKDFFRFFAKHVYKKATAHAPSKEQRKEFLIFVHPKIPSNNPQVMS